MIAGALTLSGCSSVVDQIPTAAGGLPAGVPERPAVQPPYPAVGSAPSETPPEQTISTLSPEEKKLLQDELIATRERAIQQGTAPLIDATGTVAHP